MAKIIPLNNETRKEVISKKASGLFKTKGFSATTMKDIAVLMGIEAPSLYNHINSKNEILQQICFHIANLFTTFMGKVETSNHPILEKIELLIRFHIHMMLQEYESVYVSDHEWKHLPEPYLSNYKNQRKNYQNRFANIINLGITNKELKNINPYVAVLTILSAIGGIEFWQKSRKTVDAKSLEENMVNFLIAGLKNNQSAFTPKLINLKSK